MHPWLTIATIAPAVTAGPSADWWTGALATAIAVAAARALARVRGTTLAAPAAWAVVAALFLAGVEFVLVWRGGQTSGLAATTARYASAVVTLCPLMAVLGAKRPQDRGWQWIVLSLWIVLLVPAGQAWAARGNAPMDLAPLWRLLLIGLASLSMTTYLPTRFFFAAFLTAIGQTLLLSEFVFERPSATDRDIGICVIFLAAVVASWQAAAETSTDQATLGQFSTRWLAFRNGWGAFWALRIMNRINETAQLSNWPVRLEWSGFCSTSDGDAPEIDERIAAHIDQTMDSLLRRFECTNKSTSPSDPN